MQSLAKELESMSEYEDEKDVESGNSRDYAGWRDLSALHKIRGRRVGRSGRWMTIWVERIGRKTIRTRWKEQWIRQHPGRPRRWVIATAATFYFAYTTTCTSGPQQQVTDQPTCATRCATCSFGSQPLRFLALTIGIDRLHRLSALMPRHWCLI